MNNTILIAEDDHYVASVLQQQFSLQGFVTHVVEQGDKVEMAILKHHPDCVILDIGLPFLSGYEVLERIKNIYSGAVVFYTNYGSEDNEISALQHGADDFVIKSKNPQILIERVKRLVRHNIPVATHSLSVGQLYLNDQNQQCRLDKQEIHLSESEFEVLLYLAQHADNVISREQCYMALKGTIYDGKSRIYDLNISRIKEKLCRAGGSRAMIKSVRGKGYVLVSEQCHCAQLVATSA